MTRRTPVQKSKYISNEFSNYLRSTFRFDDSSYQEMFEKKLDEQKLFKGPYVSATLPYKSGKSFPQVIL